MNIEFTPTFCYVMAFAAVLIATISQILLKQQANTTGQKKSGFIWKFLNVRVIVSYGLLFLSLALNQVALICVPVSVLPCITATSFIWIQCHLFARATQQEKDSGCHHYFGGDRHLPTVKRIPEKAKEPVDNWLRSGIMKVPGHADRRLTLSSFVKRSNQNLGRGGYFFFLL